MGNEYRETGSPRADLLEPYALTICDGLAERGRRRAERPLLGWIRVGLESYIDSDQLIIYLEIRNVKMINTSIVNTVLKGTN